MVSFYLQLEKDKCYGKQARDGFPGVTVRLSYTPR